jgi:crotonobetaine/carnitine-CoA ligase
VVRPLLSWTTSAGYLRQPEQSLATWRNGWLHSGDALYQDEEGNFFFVDRLDDAIRRRGENVSSAEVEMHINAHPAVAECAAIAVPSDFAEDEIKAVVVLHEGAKLKESDLIAFLRDTMPRFMVPRYLLFVEALPKTATSKVKKAELRKADLTEAWDAHAREG